LVIPVLAVSKMPSIGIVAMAMDASTVVKKGKKTPT
jgi:hypothetical protein